MITISQIIKSKIRHEITLKGHSQISDRISDQIYDNACHQVFEIISDQIAGQVGISFRRQVRNE